MANILVNENVLNNITLNQHKLLGEVRETLQTIRYVAAGIPSDMFDHERLDTIENMAVRVLKTLDTEKVS